MFACIPNMLNRSTFRLFILFAVPLLFSLVIKSPSKIKKGPCKSDLIKAFVTGNSKCLPPKVYKSFKEMNLLHLTTLSGIHLSAILTFIVFIKRIRPIVLMLMVCSTFLFTGFYSFKRMIWIKWLSQYLDIRLAFVVVFSVDLLWGSFFTSQLSHIYSFCFLGIILSSSTKNSLALSIEMMCMQGILTFYMGGQIYLLTFLCNFILIPLFALFFPISIISYFLNITIIKLILTAMFSFLTQLLYLIVKIIPSIHVSSLLAIIFVIYLLRLRSRVLILTLLLLYPHHIHNWSLNINYKVNNLQLRRH
jgi:hypothetical protein